MDGVEVEEVTGVLSVTVDQRDNPTSPFDEEALDILVTKPVNVAQLAAEITEALDGPVRISQQETRNPGETVLFITPVIDETSLCELVDAHAVDPRWGLPPLDEALEPALEKLRAGSTLTTKEISAVLRVLIG
jgi:hypothetical protein